MKTHLLAAASIFFCISAAAGELSTLDGEKVDPTKAGDAKFAAVIFITTDCPIANAYAPEFNRLDAHAKKVGGKLTLIHVDTDLQIRKAKKHRKDYALKSPIVIDRDHAIVEKLKAEVTPEAVVLTPEGKIVYQGKVNDLYVDYGDRRREATQHYFRDAMDAVAAGNSVKVAKVEPIGCYIPDKK